jgi:hypothetical protein
MAMTRKQRAQLSAFIQRKRRSRRRSTRDTPVEMDPAAPLGGWFTPACHGLTLEQCRVANRLLRQRNEAQPIRGASPQARFRRAQRHAGILSAVKNGRVGDAHFGYWLHGHRGGNVMRDHALHHLRTIAPVGARAAQAAREGRKILKAWEQRQNAPQTYTEWQRSLTNGPAATGPQQDFMAY